MSHNDIDRAHTLAHLFDVEHGGDLSDPDVLNAASAALSTYDRSLEKLRRTGRLRSSKWEDLHRRVDSVRDDFTLASEPGLVMPAEGCSCEMSRITPISEYQRGESTDDKFQEGIRVVATWAARRSPEAERWIQQVLNKCGDAADQAIFSTVILLAQTLDQADTLDSGLQAAARDTGTSLADQTITALITAIRDRDPAKAERALITMRCADPAQHRHNRHAVLNKALKSLGDSVLDRADAVARAFLVDGGGYLADPAVHHAAHAALYTIEMVLGGGQESGLLGLDEESYFTVLGLLSATHKDFTLASRYTAIPGR
jgi:hypothetical protein